MKKVLLDFKTRQALRNIDGTLGIAGKKILRALPKSMLDYDKVLHVVLAGVSVFFLTFA